MEFLAPAPIQIREAQSAEHPIIAEQFYQMWRDNGVLAEQIESDWRTITLQFMQYACQALAYKAFVADLNGRLVASAGCQLFAGLYPLILKDEYRKYGYIWGVYVESSYRGQGLGTQLTKAAIAHLKDIGCTRAILHASPFGKPIYTNLGFVESNEMRLDLG